MSAFDTYLALLRTYSRLDYPVWPLGAPVRVGDYGTFTKRAAAANRFVFERIGNLSEMLDERLLVTESFESDESLEDTRGASFHMDAGAGAQAAGASARGSLTFSGEGSALVQLEPRIITRAARLRDLMKAAQGLDVIASEGMVFIAEVSSADRGVVALSDRSEWGLNLSGKAAALKLLNLADASVSVEKQQNDTILRRFKSRTPVMIRLYGRKNFFSGKVVLQMGAGGPQIEPIFAQEHENA